MSKPSLDLVRAQRAATETMRVTALGQGRFTVVGKSQTPYAVNTLEDTCTCRDFRNRIVKLRRHGNPKAQCKHLLRVNNGTKWLQAQLLYTTARPRTEWKESV